MLASATSRSPGWSIARHGADALDVNVGIAADFELESRVTLGAVPGDPLRHGVGRFLRDRAVQADAFAEPPAQERADRQPGGLPEDVPARDVDPALDVRVALEGGVHAVVELQQLARVEADQVRGELAQPGPDALGVGGQVERARAGQTSP